jgi:hypothetical protein
LLHDFLPLYTAGRTAQLVAKYRPPMPILTLVVPRLVNDGIRWRLEGKCVLFFAWCYTLLGDVLELASTPQINAGLRWRLKGT